VGLLLVILLVVVGFFGFLYLIIGVPLLLAEKVGIGSLEQDIKRRVEGITFNPDKKFIFSHTAIAFDTKEKLFYVGTRLQGPVKGAIYPISKLIKYNSGHDWRGKYQKFFLDLTIDDIASPVWRIWFGGDHHTLAQVTSTIDVVWHHAA